jgi:hypothetical protein
MINFHSALLRFIMKRHQRSLQNLDIFVWTLTVSMAETISQLSALRSLSVTVQEIVYARTAQRKISVDQTGVWQALAESNDCEGSLRQLRINSGTSPSHNCSSCYGGMPNARNSPSTVAMLLAKHYGTSREEDGKDE